MDVLTIIGITWASATILWWCCVRHLDPPPDDEPANGNL